MVGRLMRSFSLGVIVICGSGISSATVKSTQTTTIPVYSTGLGYQNLVLHSGGTVGVPFGPIVDLGGIPTINQEARAYLPFKISQENIGSIQSAATTEIHVYLRNCDQRRGATLSLYGYPNRGDDPAAHIGDYSSGTLLSSIAIPADASSGWVNIDVTKFAIQQVDGGNTALVFRLQLDPDLPTANANSSRRSGFTAAATMKASMPYLEIAHTQADPSTFNNKLLVGYQGWFRASGDVAGSTSWAHWFNGTPSISKEAFDSWPDMSEYTAAEQFAVPNFTYPDGSPATVYSGQNARTVLRHFQWMENEGIDAVMLSEFGNSLPGGSHGSDYPSFQTVLDNVRAAADATGRAWAFEYDTSGMNASTMFNIITTQWQKMVDEGYTSNPQYLHQGGLPVVQIYGFFPNTSNQPLGIPNNGNPLITYFKTPGKYQAVVIGSGAQNFSTGSADYLAMLMRLDAYVPWNVGHIHKDSTTGNIVATVSGWPSDYNTFTSNGVKFIPVVFPGTNLAGPPTYPPTAPRRDGNFLWEQFVELSQIPGINTLYVAMFDEVNEGTQIMPITATPPAQASPFYTYDSDPGDWYERLVVQGETMLLNGTQITTTIPIQP